MTATHDLTTPEPAAEPAAGVVAVPTRTVALVLLVAGLIGLAAAFILTVEKFWLLTNPSYTPSCSVSSVVACDPVMSSPQAEAFGFPNSLLGIAGFAVVAATGAVLLAGGRLARWYQDGLLVGATAGVLFVGWLISQSLFVIGALCLYCMVVWAATFATFWYATLHRLGGRPGRARRIVDIAINNHSAVLAAWLTAVAALVVVTIWTR